MLNHLRAEIVSLDEENPLSKTTDEIHADIQRVATEYYNKHNKCEVYAHSIVHLPCYGCTESGEKLYHLGCTVVVKYGDKWVYGAEISLFATRKVVPEHTPNASVPIAEKYDVWEIDVSYSRAGRPAVDPH